MHGRLPLAFMLGIGEWQSGHCTASIFFAGRAVVSRPSDFCFGRRAVFGRKKTRSAVVRLLYKISSRPRIRLYQWCGPSALQREFPAPHPSACSKLPSNLLLSVLVLLLLSRAATMDEQTHSPPKASHSPAARTGRSNQRTCRPSLSGGVCDRSDQQCRNLRRYSSEGRDSNWR